jgi:uncharacterized protein (TIGR02996 family)
VDADLLQSVEALLRQAEDSPTDATLRLVLADALDESGRGIEARWHREITAVLDASGRSFPDGLAAGIAMLERWHGVQPLDMRDYHDLVDVTGLPPSIATDLSYFQRGLVSCFTVLGNMLRGVTCPVRAWGIVPETEATAEVFVGGAENVDTPASHIIAAAALSPASPAVVLAHSERCVVLTFEPPVLEEGWSAHPLTDPAALAAVYGLALDGPYACLCRGRADGRAFLLAFDPLGGLVTLPGELNGEGQATV